jgi:hypothetical protein
MYRHFLVELPGIKFHENQLSGCYIAVTIYFIKAIRYFRAQPAMGPKQLGQVRAAQPPELVAGIRLSDAINA